MPEDKQTRARTTFVTKMAPKFLEVMEGLCAGLYVTGDKMTIADLKLYSLTCWIKSGALEGIPVTLMTDSMKYPKISGIYHAVRTNPKVMGWNQEHEDEDY